MMTKRELSSRLRYYADHANELDAEIFKALTVDLLREAANALDDNERAMRDKITSLERELDKMYRLHNGG